MVWGEEDRETLQEMTSDPGDKKEIAVECAKGIVSQELQWRQNWCIYSYFLMGIPLHQAPLLSLKAFVFETGSQTQAQLWLASDSLNPPVSNSQLLRL